MLDRISVHLVIDEQHRVPFVGEERPLDRNRLSPVRVPANTKYHTSVRVRSTVTGEDGHFFIMYIDIRIQYYILSQIAASWQFDHR